MVQATILEQLKMNFMRKLVQGPGTVMYIKYNTLLFKYNNINKKSYY